MIKSLKKKIAMINLLLAGIILFTALLVVFIIGFSRIQMESQRRMDDVLAGKISHAQLVDNDEFSDITLIVIPHNGLPATVVASQASRVDRQVLIDQLPQILESTKSQGYIMRMRCKYIKQIDATQTNIVILDGFARSSNYGSYFAISVLSVFLGLGCFYLISTILAHVALQPVEESWQKQTQFVADASHELKTPLSIIIANTDVISSHPNETVESQQKWLEATRSESQRMSELVSNLLFLTKNDSGLQVNMEKVSLSDCIGTTALSCDAIFYENGKTFNFDIERDIYVYGNKQQLSQLATILLDNANKYSTGIGNVQLNLVEADKYVQLTISNDSNEPTTEQLNRMFDRFYTLDSSHNKKTSGHGLGLAIAKTICETHNGKIKVDYANGRTTFTATLPLYDSKKAQKLISQQKTD